MSNFTKWICLASAFAAGVVLSGVVQAQDFPQSSGSDLGLHRGAADTCHNILCVPQLVIDK